MDFDKQRVLLFGDSLSSGASSPGGKLAALIAGAGAAVRINARVGRSAHNFYAREDHEALLSADAAWRPAVAIVWLGTNDVGLNLEVDAKSMRRIRDALRATGARVVAVGPPTFPGVEKLAAGRGAVLEMLRGVFGPSQVVDAGPLTPAEGRSADGVHFTAAGAEPLAKALFAALRELGAPRAAAAKTVAGATLLAGVGVLAWIVGRRIRLGSVR